MERRKGKKQLDENLIFGRQPLVEALQKGSAMEKLLIQRGLKNEIISEIKQLAHKNKVQIQEVPLDKLNRVTRKNHQGVMGWLALIPYHEVEDILSNTYEAGEVPLFLICDGITDVRNFGAMARTAACAKVHGIIITEKGSVFINADAIKSSAGALLSIPVCKVRFLDQVIKYLQNNGLQIVATTIETEKYIKDIDLNVPTAIIMGAEGKGVSPKHEKMADCTAKIPILGDFDSYNVSVATGMVLYETMNQRMNNK